MSTTYALEQYRRLIADGYRYWESRNEAWLRRGDPYFGKPPLESIWIPPGERALVRDLSKAVPDTECRECGAEFPAPPVGKCPQCGSRYLRRLQA